MRNWLNLLGGLLIWAAHFFTLYAVGSIFLTTDFARGLTIALTIACLAGIAMMGARAWRARPTDVAEQWARTVALWGTLISAIAIIWQGLVALLI